MPVEVTEFSVVAEDGCVLRGLRYSGSSDGALSGTALCLHGLGSQSSGTRFVALALARAGLTVYTPDMRGHGLSDTSSLRKLRLQQFARDVVRICATLGEKELVLVGMSYGGSVGLEVLRAQADVPRVLALIAYAPPWHVARQSPSHALRSLRSLGRFLRLVARGSGYTFRRRPARVDYPTYRDTPDFHLPLLAAEARVTSWVRLAWLLLSLRLRAYLKNPKWSTLGHLPLYLFGGRHDRFVSNLELEVIAQRLACPVEWFECNHTSVSTTVEHAEAFANAAIRICAALRSPTL